MAVPVFPEIYGFSIHKRPTFATIVPNPSKSGRSVSSAQQRIPTWEFELLSEVLRDETQNSVIDSSLSGFKEFQDLSQLFLACAGQYGEFFFEDTSDNSRLEQVLGTGDGAETEFLFIRTLATGSSIYTEPVGGVNINHTIHVYVNAVEVLAAGNWNLSADLTTLIFDDPPGSGTAVTATFYYYYRCRFITNEQEFEEFLYNRWSARGVRFRSIIVGSMAIPVWIPLDPPPPPEPPVDVSPTLNGTTGSAIVDLYASNPTQLQPLTISTTKVNDLISIFVISHKNGTTIPQIVSTITSTSGLTFTRRGGGSVVLTDSTDGAVNLECWTAPSALILTGEIITVSFDIPTGVAAGIAFGVNGVNLSSPLDTGVSPPAFDGEDSGAGPSVTITTTNAYDLLLWAAGGRAINANIGTPTGFSLIGTKVSSNTHQGRVLSLAVSYKIVSSLQVSAVVAPSSSLAPGAGLLAALKG